MKSAIYFFSLNLLILLIPVILNGNPTTLPSTINTNTTLSRDGSPYIAATDVTVSAGVTLTVEAGVEIRFRQNSGLYVYGRVLMNGTSSRYITIKPDTGASKWEVISIINSTGNSAFSYVRITGATSGNDSDRDRAAISASNNQEIMLDHVEIRDVEACIYYHTTLEKCYFTNCTFETNYRGSILALVRSDVVIDNCDFIGNDFYNSDAIDFDKVTAIISNNRVHDMTGGEADGIDMGSASDVTLTNNVIYNCSDSGIEAEESTKIYASRNVIYNCGIGITIKEKAEGILVNNTIYNVNTGFSAYSEQDIDTNGGKITARNNILSSCSKLFSSKNNSTLTFSYNLHDSGSLSGTGNINGNPLFVRASSFDFHLQPGSDAIDNGDPSSPRDDDGTRADIGAFAYFQKDVPNLIITEINYRPMVNGFENMDQEYFEIYNMGSSSLNLAGYQVSSGVEFTFPTGTTLLPGSYLLVVRDASYYPSALSIYEWTSGNLSNTGELIEIRNASGDVVISLTYSSTPPWPKLPLDVGLSIHLNSLESDYKIPGSWRTSFISGGSPGAANNRPVITQLYINELVSRFGESYPDEHGLFSDWIELYNGSGYDIDLGGLYLTDSYTELNRVKITEGYPDSTCIKSHAFFVFRADAMPNLGVNHLGFQLASSGEEVALSQPSGQSFHLIDSISYGHLGTDVSYGRTSDGAPTWRSFISPTPGQPNSGSGFSQDSGWKPGEIKVSVFPNPATDQMHIAIETSDPTAVNLSLVDLTGKIISSHDLNPIMVQVSHLVHWNLSAGARNPAPGIYYLIASSGKETISRKIVILEKN